MANSRVEKLALPVSQSANHRKLHPTALRSSIQNLSSEIRTRLRSTDSHISRSTSPNRDKQDELSKTNAITTALPLHNELNPHKSKPRKRKRTSLSSSITDWDIPPLPDDIRHMKKLGRDLKKYKTRREEILREKMDLESRDTEATRKEQDIDHRISFVRTQERINEKLATTTRDDLEKMKKDILARLEEEKKAVDKICTSWISTPNM